MPEKRLARARGTLPAGFQFGDGKLPMGLMWRVHEWRLLGASGPVMACRVLDEDTINLPPSWRAAHVNAAERLGWNTIEGDHE